MSQVKNFKHQQTKCNKSHLTLDKRKILLECLRQNLKQMDIAIALDVNKTTVTREILAHRKLIPNNRQKNKPRLCEKRQNCDIKHLCKDLKCITKCKNCSYDRLCTKICPSFVQITCKRQTRFPYVCDGCEKQSICQLPFYRYDPSEANKEALTTLSTSRIGINMTEEEFANLDAILVDGTQKGQSVEHIVHANDLDVSPRTVRRYIKQGYTTTKPIDTPRGVAYRPRKPQISKEQQINIRNAKVGRDLASFLNFASNNPFVFFTQIDTVEGKKNDINQRRLLTIIVVRVRLFYCIPIEKSTSSSVVSAFNEIYRMLGEDDYKFLFNVLVTDNGSEFADVNGIEMCPDHQSIRSKVFFCNPYASWEKGAIEVCHELLRRIVPKGSSLANITTKQTQLINSHINSYFRQSNGELSAYDTFVNAFGERAKRILKKLHIERIDPKDVVLHPSLIKR